MLLTFKINYLTDIFKRFVFQMLYILQISKPTCIYSLKKAGEGTSISNFTGHKCVLWEYWFCLWQSYFIPLENYGLEVIRSIAEYYMCMMAIYYWAFSILFPLVFYFALCGLPDIPLYKVQLLMTGDFTLLIELEEFSESLYRPLVYPKLYYLHSLGVKINITENFHPCS